MLEWGVPSDERAFVTAEDPTRHERREQELAALLEAIEALEVDDLAELELELALARGRQPRAPLTVPHRSLDELIDESVRRAHQGLLERAAEIAFGFE